MAHSTARVGTDRPHRYAKQLAGHLGHRVEASWDDKAGTGTVAFQGSSAATLTAEPDALVMELDAADDELDRLEDVLGRHLARFGTKDELVVTWQRDNGTAGTTQQFS